MLAYSLGGQVLKSSAPRSFKYTYIYVGLHTRVCAHTHRERGNRRSVSSEINKSPKQQILNSFRTHTHQVSTTDKSESTIEQTRKGCVHNFLLLMAGFECGIS